MDLDIRESYQWLCVDFILGIDLVVIVRRCRHHRVSFFRFTVWLPSSKNWVRVGVFRIIISVVDLTEKKGLLFKN
jgi:hypothetical protein